MHLLITSYLAGVLTILAPCVLPVLPVILGSTSLSKDRRATGIIIGSFAVSVFVFSIILKVSTALISIPPSFWTGLTALILVGYGLLTLFPTMWARILGVLGLQATSDHLLQHSRATGGVAGQILVGASLGPLFASCSPTYALILATIFPVSLIQGVIYLVVYIAGLMTMLVAVASLGGVLVKQLKIFTNPSGWFRVMLGIIFIILGVIIATGLDKKVETALLDAGYLDVTKIEQEFLTTIPSIAKNTPINNSSLPTMNLDDQIIPAPELIGITDWINTSGNNITLADMRGKVILIDFWTYSCINCQRTLPYLRSWHEKYEEKGLVILGIHAPEFAFERERVNVEKAVSQARITYPVGLDNDYATWKAYDNKYWPAKYFIDRKGNLRHYHFGEGDYKESERIIQVLLSEDGQSVSEPLTEETPRSSRYGLTPETYLGYGRHQLFAQRFEVNTDTAQTFSFPSDLKQDEWALQGTWKVGEEAIESQEDGAKLRLKYSAKDVYLVIDASEERQEIEVTVDGSTLPPIPVTEPTLYHLVSSESYGSGKTLEIVFPRGVSAHAFTFGG